MEMKNIKEYETVRGGGTGYYGQKRGLIEVSGKEAEMFLNGLITNDVKKLEENSWMSAAFPNAQGRLLAVVRVWQKNGKFYFDTEAATYEAVLKNLERFTLAGDFFVKDLTGEFTCFSVFGGADSRFNIQDSESVNKITETSFEDEKTLTFPLLRGKGFDVFVPNALKEKIENELKSSGAVELGEEAREVLRIENGLPLYGVDMDDATIVPEINLEGLISYNKGCYIGQEIIARIHFRGHVAKQLTGLMFEDESAAINPNDEIKSADGKNAGRVTSVTFSPTLEKTIALAYVRYAFLAEETELKVNDCAAKVRKLPFVE